MSVALQTYLQLVNLRKSFDDALAVDNLSLDVREGEFITLLGPSGCGKTTTLRMIAGLVKPTSGDIILGGKTITNWDPRHRNLGMVFQSYALFPLMTVFDNVAFGLLMHKCPKSEVSTRVRSALEMVRLAGFEDRYPKQLSGGQQQHMSVGEGYRNRTKNVVTG